MNLEVLRFLFVGIGSNVINFLVYYLAYNNGVTLFIASLAGYATGLIVSYHFGRIWVFGQKFNLTTKSVIRFSLVYLVGGLGMSGIIALLVKTFVLDYRISWFWGAFFAVINNFLGLKFLVFKRNIKNHGN